MTVKSRPSVKAGKKGRSQKADLSSLPEIIVSNIACGIYIVQNGIFVYTSPVYQKLTGYPDTDLIGNNPLDYLHPDDRETTRKNAIRNLKGKSSRPYEYRFIRKDGEVMWILEMITSITYKGKRAALGSFMDITERRRTEETLRQSEEKYRAIIKNIQDGYFELDLAGNFTFFNDSICSIHGYPREELMGMNNRQYTDKEDAQKAIEAFRKILETGKPVKVFDYGIIRKDGTKRAVEVSASLILGSSGNPVGFRGITRDITARKQMEEDLRQSEEKYRTIIENIQEGYFELDLAGNYTFVNEVNCRFLGYTKEEMIGMNSRQHMDEETANALYQPYRELYLTGKAIESLEVASIRKDGTKVVYETSVTLITDSKGKPIGFRGVSRDITDRKRMEEQIRESEERYRNIVEQMEDGYFETDLLGKLTFVNDAECRIIGFSREELVGTDSQLFTDTDIFQELSHTFAEVYRTGIPVRAHAFEVTRKDKTKAFHEISVSLIKDPDGKPTGFRGIARDVTDRKRMEEQIRESEERYRTIIEEMEEWYFETDLAGNIHFFNDLLAKGLGYSHKELTGENFRAFVREEDIGTVYQTFHEVYETGEAIRNFPYELVRPDGDTTFTEFSIFPQIDAEGKILGFRGVGRDITERKRAEERIQYLATHDTLTGLPNRLMFNQLLNHAIQGAQRYKRQLAVFFIDLDRFKIINDTLGHEAGDQLLQEIAMRLRDALRAVDVIARLGGDEFVILIEEVSEQSQAATVAHNILSAVIKPMMIMGQECRVTASIGISIYPKDAKDEQSLMKTADIAMYAAKEEGKNNYQFYSKGIKSQSIERLLIEANLRQALKRRELYLHYQAKLDFKTNAITGVEALLRWENPSIGSVTPLQFIPVAEETGLIVPIGRWVLQTACNQNVAWQKKGLPPICMAVNLSLRQLMDAGLIEDVEKALAVSGMEPGLLELEITESMVMHNPARMIKVLARIKEIGVRLAIDDFGTGYSSLSQIKHFPIDTLKVDRSFIRNIPDDSEDKAITDAIIAMGKTLSLTVVAEGVETQDQMDFLKEHACDEMQGYYFSKPILPEQFADLLRTHPIATQRKPGKNL